MTAMLAVAGVHPTASELEALGAAHRRMRRQLERLYAVDTGDLPPASMLRAVAVEGGGAP